MKCSNCGQEMPDTARFCENCGAKLEAPAPTLTPDPAPTLEASPAPTGKPEGHTVGGSGNICLCPDGVYRWVYEYSMMKNPTILFTVFRVLFLACLVPFLITFFSALSGGFSKALKAAGTTFAIVFGIFLVLGLISYVILAAIYGWKYIVLFEMSETHIVHSQQEKQFKKAQAIGWLTAMSGAVSHKVGVVGTGLITATRNAMVSNFESVKSIQGLPERNTIKVNERLGHNQVYVEKADYEFVWEFITSHCPGADIK